MNARALKWTNLVVFLVTLGMNAAAVLLPLAGRRTQDVSAMYEHLFTPANYTFSIWSVLYTLLLINAVDSLRRPDPEDPSVNRARAYLIAANLLNTLWLVLWHNLLIGLTLPVMLGILGCLIAAYASLERASLSGWAEFAQRGPVAAYLGWISVATIANTGNLLVALGWNLGLEAGIWAMLLALIAGGLGAALARTRGGLWYCASLAWGMIGVLNRTDDARVSIGLYLGLALIALAASSRFWRPPLTPQRT